MPIELIQRYFFLFLLYVLKMGVHFVCNANPTSLPLNLITNLEKIESEDNWFPSYTHPRIVCVVKSRNDPLSTFLMFNFNQQILRMINVGIQPVRFVSSHQLPGLRWIPSSSLNLQNETMEKDEWFDGPKKTVEINQWIEKHIENERKKMGDYFHVFHLEKDSTQSLLKNEKNFETEMNVWIYLPMTNDYVPLWHKIRKHAEKEMKSIAIVPIIEENARLMRHHDVLGPHGQPIWDQKPVGLNKMYAIREIMKGTLSDADMISIFG